MKSSRNKVSADISELPLGELLELKDRIGSKAYRHLLPNSNADDDESRITDEVPIRKRVFKRDNRKRPREMSSKIPVNLRPMSNNAQSTSSDYFLSRQQMYSKQPSEDDLKELRQSYKTESDPEKKQKLKEAFKREENRKRTLTENDRNKSIIRDLRKMNAERMKQGKPPIYLKQSQLKRLMLEEKFTQLQRTGKLDKYLQRKHKQKAKQQQFVVN